MVKNEECIVRPLKVAKFGGTSVGSADPMKKCARIVMADSAIKIVVLSATSGTTNQLLQCAQLASQKKQILGQNLLKQIMERHLLMGKELEIDDLAQEELQKIGQRAQMLFDLMLLSPQLDLALMDHFAGLGEQLSTLLFVGYLRSQSQRVIAFDVKKVMLTDDHFGEASPLLDKLALAVQERIHPLLQQNHLLVTQGFIGCTEDGRPTTLGRGGSDFSAALLGEALNVDCVQIWTDVSGVYSMDPRIIPNAKQIPELTYDEAAELANLGAKVLHPLTLIPMIRKNIPVYVGYTLEPEKQGTWIRETSHSPTLVRALALRKNQSILTLSKIKALETHGHLAKIFAVFAKHRISIDLITTSEISTAVTLNDSSKLNFQLLSELEELAEVKLESSLALISIIGPDLITPAGLAAQIFSRLSHIPLRFICMGSGRNNISFLVQEKWAQEVLQILHGHFLEDEKKKDTFN